MRLEQALVQLLKSRGLELSAPQQEPEMRVRDALENYMLCRGQYVKSGDRYRQLFAHLTRHMGDRGAGIIRQSDVDRYVAQRREEGAAEKTAWNELAALRTALNYAWMNDALKQRPKFRLHKPRSRRMRVAWPEEMTRLVEMAGIELRRVILAAYTTGMRRADIIEAKRENLHGTTLLVDNTKTGEPKAVQLGPALLDLLEQQPRHDEVLFCRYLRRNSGRVYGVGKWHKSPLRRQWLELCKACGVTGLTFHDLRRSFASVAQDRGHSLPAVRTQGGWADPAVLQRAYSWASRGQTQRLAEDLEGLVVV